MADLETTGRKMEELVAFWRKCDLVTGTRTPPSPQWPDPRAKLCYLYELDYLTERLDAINIMFSINGDEREKRREIEDARWKEAVLYLHCDPLTSELDIFERERSLWNVRSWGNFPSEWLKPEIFWKNWEPSELQKREVIWKRWELAELPLTERLLQKLDVIWKKGYEDFWDREYVEDDMINVLSR